jgi:hypothetical protein
MRIACWMARATDKHVRLNGFLLQQWLHKHFPVLCYTYVACLVILTLVVLPWRPASNCAELWKAASFSSLEMNFTVAFVVLNLLRWIFFIQCHQISVMDFVISPPGCCWSVTDFWGWDARETQLRCPDEVDGDTWIWSTWRGLKPKFYWTTQTMVTMGILPYQGKIPMVESGFEPGSSWFSSQKLWPLDHEAGP